MKSRVIRLCLAVSLCASGLLAWGRTDALEWTVCLEYRPESPWTKHCHVKSVPSGFDLYIGPSGLSYVIDGSEKKISGTLMHPEGIEDGTRHAYALVVDQKHVEIYLDSRRLARTEVAACGTFDIGSIELDKGIVGEVSNFQVVPEAIRVWPEPAPLPPPRPGVYAFSGMDWVHPGNFAAKLTNAVRRISIRTAANERENVQLFVVPGMNGRTKLRVGVKSTLCTRDGQRANFGIRLNRILYTAVLRPSHFMHEGAVIPDRLEPADSFVRSGNDPFAIWLEVETPTGTPGGVYRGCLNLEEEGGASTRVCLEVHVCGFELPHENTVPTLVNLWERDILSYACGDPQRYLALIEKYCDLLVDHRLNPIYLHEVDLIADEGARRVYPDYACGATNWEAFDALTERLFKRGMSRVVAGPYYRTPEVWRNAAGKEKTWREVRTHLVGKGWLEKSVAYCIDEWGEKDLAEAARVGEAMKAWAPGVKWTITGANNNYPAPDRLSTVDIWLPQLHWVNPVEKAREQAQGKEVWYYVCTGPQFPTPNLHADTPLAAIRMVPGFGLRFGFDGFLHWGANFNTGRNAQPTQAYEYGEGQYVFADADGNPVATCRLKALGDGMEDWMAFRLLRQLDAAEADKLMTAFAKLVPERAYDTAIPIGLHDPWEGSYGTFLERDAFYSVYAHPARYLAWRERLYAAIERFTPGIGRNGKRNAR